MPRPRAAPHHPGYTLSTALKGRTDMTDQYDNASGSASVSEDAPGLPPAAWNATFRTASRAPLGELFASWAARTPRAAALVAGDRTWSFGEVDAWANRLAH